MIRATSFHALILTSSHEGMQFSPILATWPSGSVLSKLSMTLTSQADLNPISQGDIFVPFSVMWPSRYIFSEMSVTLTSKAKLLISVVQKLFSVASLSVSLLFFLLLVWFGKCYQDTFNHTWYGLAYVRCTIFILTCHARVFV